MPAPRAHVETHVRVVPVHTENVLNVHTEAVFESAHGGFAAFHTTTQDTTHKTHKTQHQQHTTTTTTTHGDMERRQRKRGEKKKTRKKR